MSDERVGTGLLDVAVEFLPCVGFVLPSGYRIEGSAPSIRPGSVRLVIASPDLAGEGVPLECLVFDRDGERKFVLGPA